MQKMQDETPLLSQEPVKGKVRTWNSLTAEACAKKIEEGLEVIGGTPFWENDPDYKAGEIVFNYTEEEIIELSRCMKDVVYFANTHCVAMTDDGVKKITLRGYQKKILGAFQKHRFNVFLASRQIGKCVSPLTKVRVKKIDGEPEEIMIYELLERKLVETKAMDTYDKLRFMCYRRMKKGKDSFLKMLEKREMKNASLEESEKIMSTFFFPETEYLVETDGGWAPISQIHLTRPYDVWKIVTESGKTLECADDHLLYGKNMKVFSAKDLHYGSWIYTKDGYEKVISVTKTGENMQMIDLTVESAQHRFYSGEFLSHNTVTSAMYITWFLIFNTDKNVLVLANKATTAAEIIDKIKMTIKGIPFFMKPGIITNNSFSMRFDNGCRLMGQSTTKTAAIGFTIHLAYLDEFAHIHRNFINHFYRSVYPTISSSQISKIIITSTPNGKNKFFEIYNDAIKKKNEYNPIRVDWWEVPERDEAWKRREIGNLGSEEMFNQEYGNQFIAADTLLLNGETLRTYSRYCQDFEFREISALEDSEINYQNLLWHKSFDLDDIDEELDRFVIKIDLGDGIGRDYSIINISRLELMSLASIRRLRKDRIVDESSFFRLRQIGLFRSNLHSPEDVAKIVDALIFNVFSSEIVKVVVEMNFNGKLFTKELQKNEEFFDDIFLHTKHNAKSKHVSIGIMMEKGNKMFLSKELGRLITEKRIVVSEKISIEEFSSYGINEKGTYSAQAGHDDIAMTFVQEAAFYKSDDFQALVEEVYDVIVDEETQELILSRLEEISETTVD
jgi:hypothetical protein